MTSSEPTAEESGVWTASGHDSIAQRASEFIDEAEDEIIYMAVEDLLTDEHLDHLQKADERGVDIYLAGISEAVQESIQNRIPSAEPFDTLWEWADTSAGRLLITDRQTALVSVRRNTGDEGGLDETAIWGSGERNSLVVVLRAIFTWRLEHGE